MAKSFSPRSEVSKLFTVTTYRDFESREHLTNFVEELVEASLKKFLLRHNTRITVTLNHERWTRTSLFQVGISLKPAYRAPIHVVKEASNLHEAVRMAVGTVEKILRREHARNLRRRRHHHAEEIALSSGF